MSPRPSARFLRRLGALLILSYGAAIVLGLFAALLADRAAARWRAEGERLVSTDLPALDALGEARGDLRTLEVRLGELLARTEANRNARGEVAAARQALEELELGWQRSRGALEALPGVPVELDRMRRLHAQLVTDAEQLLSLAETGNPDEARTLLESRMRTAFDRQAQLLATEREVARRNVAEKYASLQEEREPLRVARRVLQAGALAVALLGAFALFAYVRRVAMAAQQRVSELELFAGRVAHDLRGPLAVVGLSLEAAGRSPALDARARTSVERGQRVLQRAAEVIDGLLAFTRAGFQPMADVVDVPVAPAVAAVFEQILPAAEAHGVELEADVGGLVVRCHPGMLTSMLANLVQNGVRYMGDSVERRVRVEGRRRGGFVALDVVDTGPGVPPELAAGLFEPYARGDTRVPGLGLGLATVRRLAQASGGTITYEPATPTGGSRFRLLLPAGRRRQLAAAPQARPEPEEPILH